MEENLKQTQQPTMQEPKKKEPSKKIKSRKAKVAVITLSTIIVLVLGLQIYAATNGYGNVFFMIRDWTTSKNASGEKEVFKDSTNTIKEENSNVENEVKYEISKKSNTVATIKATKNGKTVTKDFTMNAEIADTGTMELTKFGKVALIAETGGEYYGVNVYKLVDNEIKKIGSIDCGADMVKDATYTLKANGVAKVIINAKNDTETITKEIEMLATIDFTEVVDILKCGKVVLVAETGGEYYAMKAFRASQDYTNGKLKEIKEVGTIQLNYNEDDNIQLEPSNYAEEVIKYEKDTKGYVGTWKVKRALNNQKEVSLQEIYGTSVKYGVGNLILNADNTFADLIAPIHENEDSTKGKYTSSNNDISLTYNNGSKKSINYNPVDDIITYGVFDDYNLIMERQREQQLEPDNYAEEIAKDEITQKVLEYIKKNQENGTAEKLLDYKVEEVKLVSEQDKMSLVNQYPEEYKSTDYLAIVHYSVKPQNINNTNWIAANGTIEGEWVKNKMTCVTYRNGNILGMGATSF